MLRKRSNLATSTSFQNAVNSSLATVASVMAAVSFREKQYSSSQLRARRVYCRGRPCSGSSMVAATLLRTPELSLRWIPVWRRNLLVWRKLALASLRQTSRLRRHTGIQRSDSSGVRRSVAATMDEPEQGRPRQYTRRARSCELEYCFSRKETAAMTEATVANDEFTAFWNDVLVAKFERFRNILLDGLSYHSEVPLRTLELAKGAKVLDAGCGWGDTAIQLAKMTGPTGSVLGLDCCDAFLQKGRTDAAAAGLSNVRFVVADVQTHRFEPEYDLCFSRFGMMFFSNPVVAMRNIRSALKPGGRLLFITWRAIGDNPWA